MLAFVAVIVEHIPSTLAEPKEEHPARAPPLTAADLWFFYAANAIFSQFSLATILSIILIEIWPKHAKNEFYLNLQHNDILPPKAKSWIRHLSSIKCYLIKHDAN